METGKQHLNKAIEQLNNRKAPDGLWDAIEQELAHEHPTEQNYNTLQEAIAELPEKAVETKGMFEQIMEEVTPEPHRKRLTWPIWGVAASVVIVLGLFFRSQLPSSEEVTITYAEQTIEVATQDMSTVALLHAQDEVLSFIKANCRTFEIQCKQEGFQLLLAEYVQLESDRQELMKAIQEHQEAPQLMQYLVRLEKRKTQLGKQLMQTFI
ncbi:MAG: hypothetical protein ACPGJS_22085 [Flammeovirgaceae bacterium]